MVSKRVGVTAAFLHRFMDVYFYSGIIGRFPPIPRGPDAQLFLIVFNIISILVHGKSIS